MNIFNLKEYVINTYQLTLGFNDSLKLYEKILNGLKSLKLDRVLNVSELMDNSTDLIQSVIRITDPLELPNHTVSEYSLVSSC